MKNFVKLIQRIYQERYSVVINKIVAEKIPVAYLSVYSLQNAILQVESLRSQGLNIKHLITNATPPPEMASQLDFTVATLDKISSIRLRPEYTLVTSNIDARVAVKNLPSSKVLSIERGNRDNEYEIFMNHLTELREVYESLPDELSRRTFCGYWLSRISNQISEIVYSKNAHYLIPGFIPENGAIVIDGGVFDGGTAKVFTEMGYKVYGFEMDIRNFEVAKKVANSKGFVLENLALGSYKHEMRYNSTGTSGSKSNIQGNAITQVTTLDAYVRENNLPRVDFIKLDVEGAELDILKGAKTTIARFKPILAISAYHKSDDFWVLMNYIKSVRPDYEFAMRQGAETNDEEPTNIGVDLENFLYSFGLEPELRFFWECVLFAR